MSVLHQCPPPGGAFTPCCLSMTTELPAVDLFTTDPERVTCTVHCAAELRVDLDGGESPFGWRQLI
ncbi:hypothetical protein OOK58_42095 [Streptomyces sp. NBC_01728]|uniref:hypothetical protein n=1 Tax=unclassified Streptomyces TaxID=2593676 RepID=UPI0022532873|nr:MULTISPECIES: hypothetical protein [unclassified Streptomyces]MCX4458507.1 hypothetical protein [Streptomyces sp. NBC_01719]MCX4497864.1 hypothetical protein [Streptomyces sp. NBC_01728]